MGGLVIRAPAGIQSFTGSQYVSPANGTRRLCVRTGTGINDIVKYGLTSDTSASSYCCMRLRMDGQTAMIGRSETFTSSSSSNWTVASSSRQALMPPIHTQAAILIPELPIVRLKSGLIRHLIVLSGKVAEPQRLAPRPFRRTIIRREVPVPLSLEIHNMSTGQVNLLGSLQEQVIIVKYTGIPLTELQFTPVPQEPLPAHLVIQRTILPQLPTDIPVEEERI